MVERISSFAELLSPVPPEEFFARYHRKKWLHVPGDPAKFASVFSWERLNRLLEMEVWSSHTLQLFVDRKRVAPQVYSRKAVDRNWQQVLQPDSRKLTEIIRRGASLILNATETLDPGVAGIARAIETAVGSKCQANLYGSWAENQAFDSHRDCHDVYAVHLSGEKVWRVYEGRDDNPIEHDSFQKMPQEQYDRRKGAIEKEVRMRPGDLLYLPRGQFHDALAQTEATMHIAFGSTDATGLEWLSAMWERALLDSAFRESLPLPAGPEGEDALKAHVEKLAERFKGLALKGGGLPLAQAVLQQFQTPRADYGFTETEALTRYRVAAQGLKLVRRGQEWILRAGTWKTTLADADHLLVDWILKRDQFPASEIRAAFPEANPRQVSRVLDELKAHNVVVEL